MRVYIIVPKTNDIIMYFFYLPQVFDAAILIVSFIVDLIFVNGLPRYKIEEFVFILAFLLPWRVIRVVNSKSSFILFINLQFR